MATLHDPIPSPNSTHKRSRSRSPSPSPAPTKRPRLQDLCAERTRLQTQLKDVEEQLDSHPDAMRERIGNMIISTLVGERLTRLTKVIPEVNYRHVRLVLNGTEFGFSQCKNDRSIGWSNESEYERGGYYQNVELRGEKKKKKKAANETWADDIESFVADLKTENATATNTLHFMDTMLKYTMPRLDIQAALVAYCVFYDEGDY